MNSPYQILKEKNPQVHEFVETWIKKYSRVFDLSKEEDQANFYEGIIEIARHIAMHSKTAAVNLELNTEGVDGLAVSCIPQSNLR